MTLGNKLQNLRKERNMSQEDLANLLNISRQAISKWELDQSLPDTANIIAISKIFNVTTDYLLLDKEPSSVVSGKSVSKKFIFLICGTVSLTTGFIGNFTIYIFSRFIKVPVPIGRVRNGPDGEWRTVMGLRHNFFRFISQQDLWLLFWFFILLFILGVALLTYQYRHPIKEFLAKIYTKIKTFKLKKKSDTTD